MIFQGEALEMEADQIARQNVGHRLRIFFLQRDPVAQLHAAGPALRPMRERSAGPRPGERAQRSRPFAGPGGGVKAAVNFACQRRSLTIIFTEDEYCLIDVKVCVMMLTHDTEHVLKV